MTYKYFAIPPTAETVRKVVRATDLITSVGCRRADMVRVPINTQLQLGVGEANAQQASPDTSLK